MNNSKFLLAILLFISTYSYSQSQSYYWSGQKKINLVIDSLTIIVHPSNNNLIGSIRSIRELKSLSSLKSGYLKIELLEKVKIDKEQLHYSYKTLSSNKMIPTGEILLAPKNGESISKILTMSSAKLSIQDVSKYGEYKLRVEDNSNILDLANLFYESGLVKFSHPNFIAQIERHQNDNLYPDQYYLNNTGQFGGTSGIDINAPQAWTISNGLGNVRVAVIDDGVENNHEDMQGRVLQGFTPTNPNGFGAPLAAGEHGQQCAGIIAATSNNTIGIAGIAQCSQIIPINIFNGGEDIDDLVDAIDWAWDDGQADVISNSWGFRDSEAEFDEITEAITRARTMGRGNLGTIVVFSSGNNQQQFNGVMFPGRADGVVTVGAINRNGNIWNYSSRGPEMDLVAPSGNVNNNGDVRTTDRMGANGVVAGNYSTTFGGTSAASPQVSGVLALMLSINPNLTEVQAINILATTATDMGTAGFDNTFGNGRLNAQSAIQAVVPFISGASVVCNSETFQINNLPPGSSVTWSSTWNSPPNPTLVQNSPITNQCTINNTYHYPSSTILTATIIGPCGSMVITKNIGSDYSNPVQYGTYNQQGCYINGVYQPPLSGSLPYTVNTPQYLHEVCMTQIVLNNMGGKTVTEIGGSDPMFWAYNSSNSTLSLQLPYLQGGIPYTFKISGEGACQDKTLLFFGYREPGTSYSISPNPVVDILTITATPKIELLENSDNVPTEFEYAVMINDDQTGRLLFHSEMVKAKSVESIDVSSLRQGVYIIQIIENETKQSFRFIKK